MNRGVPLRLFFRGACAVFAAVAVSLFTPGMARAADLDCSDFGTREAANRELNRTIAEFGRDINGLDADGDGQACERSGSAMWWTGIAAALGVLAGFGLAPARAGHDDDWSKAFGHATAAFFAGLFAGWLLPGVMPRQLTVAVYALGAGAAAAFIERKIATASRVATP